MYTIDVKGKTLGRTASHVAKILSGKDTAQFQKNTISSNKVNLVNVSHAKIDVMKLNSKLYEKYSGYPGGLTKQKMAMLVSKKGFAEIFRLAIYGMLPANKLRAELMKNLTISE